MLEAAFIVTSIATWRETVLSHIEVMTLMVLPLKTPTPPHTRAVSCDFNIDASTYDSGMISTV